MSPRLDQKPNTGTEGSNPNLSQSNDNILGNAASIAEGNKEELRKELKKTTGDGPAVVVNEFDNLRTNLALALDKTTREKKYPVATGPGVTAPYDVNVYDKPAILAALNSVPDDKNKKLAFIAHCSENKIDITSIVRDAFKDGASEIEQGNRALLGFDPKRQAKLIYDNLSRWGSANQKEILTGLANISPDQSNSLSKELHRISVSGSSKLTEAQPADQSKNTLYNAVSSNLTGLNKIEGLKSIGRCTPVEAAKILETSSPQSFDISEIKRVLSAFPPEERLKIHDMFKGPDNKTLTGLYQHLHQGDKQTSYIEFVRSFDPTNTDLEKAGELFRLKDKPTEFINQLKGMSAGERYQAETQYNKYFASPLSEVPAAYTWKTIDRPTAISSLYVGRDLVLEQQGKANYRKPENKPEPKPADVSPDKKPVTSENEHLAYLEKASDKESKPTDPDKSTPKATVTPAPEPKGIHTIEFSYNKIKTTEDKGKQNKFEATIDEEKLKKILVRDFDKFFSSEVTKKAKDHDYPPGWQKEIVRLVVEEALSKQDLTSGKNLKLGAAEMNAAGLKVWERMKHTTYDNLISPKLDPAKPSSAGTSGATVNKDQVKVEKFGSHTIQVDPKVPEQVFFAKFLSAINSGEVAKIDSYADIINNEEKFNLARKIASWDARDSSGKELLTPEQKFVVKMAVDYLNNKAMYSGMASDYILEKLQPPEVATAEKYGLNYKNLSSSFDREDQLLAKVFEAIAKDNSAPVDSFVKPLTNLERAESARKLNLMAQDPDITFEQVGLLDTAIRLFNSAADKAERSAAGMAIDS